MQPQTRTTLAALAITVLVVAILLPKLDQAPPTAVREDRSWAELEQTPELAAVIARSEEQTGIAEMMPLQRLAVAIGSAPVPAQAAPATEPPGLERDLHVIRDLAGAMLQATDGAWFMKNYAMTEQPPKEEPWADYWLAIWPDLDRYIAEGLIHREIKPKTAKASDYGGFRRVGDQKMMRCTIHGHHWTVVLTFDRSNPPLPDLFERIYKR